MYKKISQLALLVLAAFVFNSCKKNFDDYYARPATLAAPIYQQLAEKNIVDAIFNLALCYKKGRGVIKDKDKATEFYKRARDQGDDQMKKRLAKLKIKFE